MNAGENNSEGSQYQFNIGINFLQRIDYLLTMNMVAREENNPLSWLRHLRSLYIELYSKFEDHELPAVNKLYSKLIEEYNNWKSIPSSHKPEITPELIEAGEKYEFFLRNKLHDLGILMPTKQISEGGGFY